MLLKSAKGQRGGSKPGGRDGQEADALRAALDQVRPALDAAAGWIDITVAGLVVRLRNLVDIMQDCQLLREAIAEDRNPDLLQLAFMPDTLTFAVPHRDHGSRASVGRVRGASVLACCAFSIATGWPDGVIAPLFAAVVGSIARRRGRSASDIPQLLRAIPHRHRHPWDLPVWRAAADHDP